MLLETLHPGFYWCDRCIVSLAANLRDSNFDVHYFSLLSFLPPSTTLRRYLRTTYATTAEQIGQLYCDIVSYATTPDGSEAEDIGRGLIAVRMKLKRNLVLKQNVSYEVP